MKTKTRGKKRSLAHLLDTYGANRNGESTKRKRVTLSEKQKKIYTVDDFLEIMKPSENELKYREKECENINAIEKYSKQFKCTNCHKSFKSIIENHEEIPTHPCLNVLMCQECCDYYLDGDFSVDSEGEEKYCRWCGEGGAILGCSICVCGFCAKCIKKHWGNKYLKKIKMNDNWICFLCNPKPLWKHRLICSLAVLSSKSKSTPKLFSKLNDSKRNEKKHLNSICSDQSLSTDEDILQPIINKESKNSKNYDISSSSDELVKTPESPSKKIKFSRSLWKNAFDKNENYPFKHKKSKALIELTNILKFSENHMDFGKAWATKMLKKLTGPDFEGTSKELVINCQKIKQFLSLMSTYLVKFSSSVDSIEQSLQNDTEQKNSRVLENDQLSFYTILQFLGFVNDQVKIFIEKGISLSSLLESEVYDDDNVVGIKKKSADSNICSNENEKTNPNSDVESEKTETNNDSESKDNAKDQNDECKDIAEDQNDECKVIAKDQNDECQYIEKDQNDECQDIAKDQNDECKAIAEDQNDEYQDIAKDQNDECQDIVEDQNDECKDIVEDQNDDSKDISEDQNDEWEDTSKAEISPDIISSQNSETNFTKGSDESNSFYLTTDMKSADSREEIQEILAILENA